MSVTGNPTAYRRELGSLLRSFRKDSGLTTEQVAQQLGISRSKISRLENGRRGASQVDISRLCDLYQVDRESRSRLSDLAAEGKQHPWWRPGNLLQPDYIGLEETAESISDYGLALVPGLLQTADYARALVQAADPSVSPDIVEERVQARMARQRLLSSEAGPSFVAVLDESVLHRVVGTPTVMLAQLRQLLELSQLPNVTVRIVPYDAGVVPSGVGKFIILRFAKPGMSDVVLIEDLTTHRYLEQSSEVEIYAAIFDMLVALSVAPTASTSMIRAKLVEYELRTH
jgi:transcriptional regulator with XRE-family HTH domain